MVHYAPDGFERVSSKSVNHGGTCFALAKRFPTCFEGIPLRALWRFSSNFCWHHAWIAHWWTGAIDLLQCSLDRPVVRRVSGRSGVIYAGIDLRAGYRSIFFSFVIFYPQALLFFHEWFCFCSTSFLFRPVHNISLNLLIIRLPGVLEGMTF